MKGTVDKALSSREIEPRDDLRQVVNREILPVLKRVREVLNYSNVYQPTPLDTAGDGALTDAWTSDEMPTNATWFVSAYVVGTGSSAGTKNAYVCHGVFESTDGTCSTIGTSTEEYESDVAADAALTLSGRTVVLQVQDAGAVATWKAIIEVVEVAL